VNTRNTDCVSSPKGRDAAIVGACDKFWSGFLDLLQRPLEFAMTRDPFTPNRSSR